MIRFVVYFTLVLCVGTGVPRVSRVYLPLSVFFSVEVIGPPSQYFPCRCDPTTPRVVSPILVVFKESSFTAGGSLKSGEFQSTICSITFERASWGPLITLSVTPQNPVLSCSVFKSKVVLLLFVIVNDSTQDS